MVPGRLSVGPSGQSVRLPSGAAAVLAFVAATAVSLLGVLVLMALVAPSAGAVNTRVSVADFQWSKNPVISRGESVIWDWPGPDLQHSVSPNSLNSAPWDSDPGTTVPSHTLGDSFKATFDQPGTYKFICKLHPSVRGTVTVEDKPGDPDSDPGPRPPLNFDVEPPYIDDWYFTRDGSSPVPGVIRSVSKGIRLWFPTAERGRADVDYYRIVKRFRWKVRRKESGRKVRRRVVTASSRQYAGYTEWKTHVGWNVVRFGARSSTFRSPRPGQYVALFRATDEVANTTDPIRLKFEIRPGRKARKKTRAPR